MQRALRRRASTIKRHYRLKALSDMSATTKHCLGGGVGLAAGKRRMPAETFPSCRVDTIAPGSRRRPPRSGLMRVQRRNPVAVEPRVGRPTVREAGIP
jgi:hypothetical protein